MAPKHNKPPTLAPTPMPAFVPVDRAEPGFGDAVIITVAAAPAEEPLVKVKVKVEDSDIVVDVEGAAKVELPLLLRTV